MFDELFKWTVWKKKKDLDSSRSLQNARFDES